MSITPVYNSTTNNITFNFSGAGLTGIDIYELSGNSITDSIQLRNNNVPIPISNTYTINIDGVQLMGYVINPYMLNRIDETSRQFKLGIMGPDGFSLTQPFDCSDNQTLPFIETPVFNNEIITFDMSGTSFGDINQIDLYKVAAYANGDRYISYSSPDVSYNINGSSYSIDINGIVLRSETINEELTSVKNGNYYLGIVRDPTSENLGKTFYISDFFDIGVRSNIYVTGRYNNAKLYDADGVGATTLVSSGSNDVFIAKYSDTGYVQWGTHIGGTGADSGYSIITDNLNNVYVTGTYNQRITLYDANGVGHTTLEHSIVNDVFIAKYSDTGYVQWGTHIAGSGDDVGRSISTDSLNNVYVTGSYNAGITLYDANGIGHTTLTNSGVTDVFIAKYSDTGYVQWGTRIAGIGDDIGYSITTDSLNNVYVTGGYKNTPTLYDANGVGHTTLVHSVSNDVFIAKYSDTGYVQWGTRIAGSGDEYGYSITTDSLNNVYVTGSYDAGITLYHANGIGHTTLTNSGLTDVFIAKYSDTGYVKWATHIGGTGNDIGNSISTDSLNNVYVTGSYNAGITLYHANGIGHTTLTNSGLTDVFIAKYSDTGYVQWGTRIAGSGNDIGNSISTDSLNNVYVTGTFSGVTLYDANGVGNTFLSTSDGQSTNTFIAKYSDTGYVQWGTHIGGIIIGNSIAATK